MFLFLFLQNYGGLILPILKSCLEKLLMECLNHEKAYHFASILHIAIKLGIFAEVSQNSAQVRSKFSTLNSMPLLDFINLNPASFRLENFNLILKFCIEIAENPSHPFKRLATVAIHKLYAGIWSGWKLPSKLSNGNLIAALFLHSFHFTLNFKISATTTRGYLCVKYEIIH